MDNHRRDLEISILWEIIGMICEWAAVTCDKPNITNKDFRSLLAILDAGKATCIDIDNGMFDLENLGANIENDPIITNEMIADWLNDRGI